eukprot:1753786-Rhodomonas_salina.1
MTPAASRPADSAPDTTYHLVKQRRIPHSSCVLARSLTPPSCSDQQTEINPSSKTQICNLLRSRTRS